MNSAYARPVLIPAAGPEQLLDRIPLTGAAAAAAYDEDWLQELLYRHPHALPIAEIDDSFSGIVPVCREMETSAGPVDVVYVTPSGRPVLVEAKLWRNPEARRKVIGQILDYAKELSRWNYETFDAAVRGARRAEDGERPKGLAEVLGFKAESPEASRFFDALQRQREEIEKAVGAELRWQVKVKDENYQIGVELDSAGTEDDRAEQFEWLHETAKRFIEVFGPRLKAST